MTTQNRRPSANRRRGSGGPRRGSRRTNPPRRPEPPKTFWDRVVAFFKGQTKPARPAATTRERPAASEPARTRRPSRAPESIEVTSPKLYVGNLSFDASESDLFDLFNGVGSVQSAEVVSHRRTQRSKGFAFVTMQSVEEARRAVEELHDKDFMGRKLVVSGAKANGADGPEDYDND